MPNRADDGKSERRPARAEPRDGQQPRRARPPRRKEIGGPDGPEPTRYGDWERNGRCTDF